MMDVKRFLILVLASVFLLSVSGCSMSKTAIDGEWRQSGNKLSIDERSEILGENLIFYADGTFASYSNSSARQSGGTYSANGKKITLYYAACSVGVYEYEISGSTMTLRRAGTKTPYVKYEKIYRTR